MLKLLITVLGALVLGQASASDHWCPYFENRLPAPGPDLWYEEHCPEYSSLACCTKSDIQDIITELETQGWLYMQGYSAQCRVQLQALACWICDPQQEMFYKDQRLAVCESMCDRVFDACGRVKFSGHRIRDMYKNGKELCESRGMDVMVGGSYPNCFDNPQEGHRVTRVPHPYSSGNSLFHGWNGKLSLFLRIFGLLGVTGVLLQQHSSGSSASRKQSAGLFLFALLFGSVFLLQHASVVSAQKNLQEAEITAAAEGIKEELMHLTNDVMSWDAMQSIYDSQTYETTPMDGDTVVDQITASLGDFFSKKTQAIKELAQEAELAYGNWRASLEGKLPRFEDLEFANSDWPQTLPKLDYSYEFQTNVSFQTSSVKIPMDIEHDQEGVVEDVFWTAALTEKFNESMQEDPTNRWTYIGTRNGIHRTFPARPWDTSLLGIPENYDPRSRPWYLGASSGPKDVVVVIDSSVSMGGYRNMVNRIAKQIIGTLSQSDYFSVVEAWRGPTPGYTWNQRNTKVLTCDENNLIPATPANIRAAGEVIDEIIYFGGTEYQQGLDKAFGMLQGSSSKSGCQKIIIYITDGKDTDPEIYCGSPGRCERRCRRSSSSKSGSSDCETYCPPLCQFPADDTLRMVRGKYNEMEFKLFSYNVGAEGQEIPGRIACDVKGSFTALKRLGNARNQLSDYFDYLGSSTQADEASWTAPYLDSLGLGLLVTVSHPVYERHADGRKTLLGVVGIDVTLKDIEQELKALEWGSVYSFLVDRLGNTIVHPQLRPAESLTADPIFSDIGTLEMLDGEPSDFLEVRTALLNGERGYKEFQTQRLIPRGDMLAGFTVFPQRTAYYYGPIPDSSYSFGFALRSPEDVTFSRPVQPADATETGDLNFYHLLGHYTPDVRAELGLNAQQPLLQQTSVTDPLRPGMRISPQDSTFKLAPYSFCQPSEYLRDFANPKDLIDLHKLVNFGEGEITDCEEILDEEDRKLAVFPGVADDVRITRKVESAWKDRSSVDTADVIWSYVGTISGVFRSFPGIRSLNGFDPSNRPWFYRAQTLPGHAAMSTPYMDASGSGIVVTLSKAVMKSKFALCDPETTECEDQPSCTEVTGRSPGCPCTENSECESGFCYQLSDEVEKRCSGTAHEGVMGVDFQYPGFQDRILDPIELCTSGGAREKYPCSASGGEECETRCYLIDDTGTLVLHDDFYDINLLTNPVEYSSVNLGVKEGRLMHHLVHTEKLFTRASRVDYQASCPRNHPWNALFQTVHRTVEERDHDQERQGRIPPAASETGCTADRVTFRLDRTKIQNKVLKGAFQDECAHSDWFVTEVPETNLLLVVMANWRQTKVHQEDLFHARCRAVERSVDVGVFPRLNFTCSAALESIPGSGGAPSLECPEVHSTYTPCEYDAAPGLTAGILSLLLPIAAVLAAHLWQRF